jgi:hypothetical protein
MMKNDEERKEGKQRRGNADERKKGSPSINQSHMHNQSEIAQPCRDGEAEKGGRI